MHLYVDAPWFPEEKDMINISNVESDDEFRVTSRLNTIKSTKTWSKGRRYSLHGTQNFMDALGAAMKEDGMVVEEGGGRARSKAVEEKRSKSRGFKAPPTTPKRGDIAGNVTNAVKVFGGI